MLPVRALKSCIPRNRLISVRCWAQHATARPGSYLSLRICKQSWHRNKEQLRCSPSRSNHGCLRHPPGFREEPNEDDRPPNKAPSTIRCRYRAETKEHLFQKPADTASAFYQLHSGLFSAARLAPLMAARLIQPACPLRHLWSVWPTRLGLRRAESPPCSGGSFPSPLWKHRLDASG